MTPLPLAPLDALHPVAIGEIVAGKYRVESVLGRGAMGVVVGARHIALDHTVAIKLLLHHLWGSREESIARFLTEARAAAKIESDHVGRVFDVGTLPDGTPYMVMEYLEGNDLETELQRRGPLPVTEAVDYVLQAADAIAAAHQLGIVHRDLKPANLFLAVRADGLRRVKVLDFGISKVTTDRRSHRPVESGTFGTPAYMSPEQIRDPQSVDTRTDVWALGSILYELLSGQLAFIGPSVKVVLDRILDDDPCPIHALRRDVPPELEAIVMRCLARDRDVRWPDASALSRALVPFGPYGSLSHLAISGGAPSMEPMVASVHDVGRAALTTQPDPEELRGAVNVAGEWTAAAVRRRKARDAALLVSSAAFLFGIIAIASWQLSTPRRRPPVAASAPAPPPPAATIAAPTATAVQYAPNHVQNAPVSPPPMVRPAKPKPSPRR